jgi:hypothetical protein
MAAFTPARNRFIVKSGCGKKGVKTEVTCLCMLTGHGIPVHIYTLTRQSHTNHAPAFAHSHILVLEREWPGFLFGNESGS